jgi:hypothetical protein
MHGDTKLNSVNKFWKTFLLLLGFLLMAAILYRHQISHIVHPSNDVPLIYIFHDEVSDDVFYYLRIADNILTNSISSFDGKSVTNGYQPLWMLVLLGLGKTQSIKSTGFMVLLFTPILALITLGSLLFYRLGGALFSGSSLIGTLSYFFSALFFSKSGMEVSLLFVFFPLFFLLLFKVKGNSTAANYFWLGVGTSLLLLSRLDIILFLATMAFCIVVFGFKKFVFSIGFTWKKALSGFFGLMPFFCYLLYNFTIYGNAIPISGQAKALRLEGGISQTGLLSLVSTISHDKIILLITLVWALSIPLAFTYIKKEVDFLRRITILSVFLFPVLYYIYYLIVSDWPFWLWYYYPIVFAFSLGVLLFEDFILRRIPVLREYYTKVVAPSFVLLLAAGAVIMLHSKPAGFIPNPLQDAAIQIKQFSDDNPGVYAMGDRAGIVGFILGSPVVQLEGIVGDNNLLNNIASQNDLIDFLINNSVNYYIATNPTKAGSCWNLEEPKIPGPSAPRMRGLICNEPIFTYTARLDDVTTMIFKVNK